MFFEQSAAKNEGFRLVYADLDIVSSTLSLGLMRKIRDKSGKTGRGSLLRLFFCIMPIQENEKTLEIVTWRANERISLVLQVFKYDQGVLIK